MDQMYKPYNEKMEKSINALKTELGTIRAGRATPAVLDRIMVDYYGVPTAINQMAAISIADARTLIIKPWDASTLKEIEKAINASDLGINPGNEGQQIRLVFPAPTEERRKELVKQIAKYGEECKVAIRSIRRDANDTFKKEQKQSGMTEDDLKNAEKEIQNLTDKFCKEVDTVIKAKENEIMEI